MKKINLAVLGITVPLIAFMMVLTQSSMVYANTIYYEYQVIGDEDLAIKRYNCSGTSTPPSCPNTTFRYVGRGAGGNGYRFTNTTNVGSETIVVRDSRWRACGTIASQIGPVEIKISNDQRFLDFIGESATQRHPDCPAHTGPVDPILTPFPEPDTDTGGGTQDVTSQQPQEDGSPDLAEDGKRPELDADCKETTLTTENCGIINFIVTGTNVLSSLVGIIIVIMIASGGVQYTISRDNPQATAAAKERIRNAILALVFFIFTYAFLQWIIPGGVF